MAYKFLNIFSGDVSGNKFFNIAGKLLLLLCIVLLLMSLWRALWGSLSSLGRVRQLRKEVGLLQERNEELKSELEEKKTLHFVEEVARRDLGMVKESEQVVVVPGEDSRMKHDPVGDSALSLKTWKEWLFVFGW
ncbi:MAG: FtsB family cell division protein [Patescibacteria group bacterium]